MHAQRHAAIANAKGVASLWSCPRSRHRWGPVPSPAAPRLLAQEFRWVVCRGAALGAGAQKDHCSDVITDKIDALLRQCRADAGRQALVPAVELPVGWCDRPRLWRRRCLPLVTLGDPCEKSGLQRVKHPGLLGVEPEELEVAAVLMAGVLWVSRPLLGGSASGRWWGWYVPGVSSFSVQ